MQEPAPRLRADEPLPRAPVLDWSSFRREGHDESDSSSTPSSASAASSTSSSAASSSSPSSSSSLASASSASSSPSVEDLPHVTYTTSGRAAIFQALLQLKLAPGAGVLVPTYHCPTMVAPIVRAGLTPTYFGLRPDGLPDLDAIDRRGGGSPRAMIVAHYFGLPRSLAEVRGWCDARGIALIEDCAHCLFGEAGDRPVGAWGDFATASLSKFLPVPEAGLVASSSRAFEPLDLRPQGLKAQVKGWVDVFEFATRHRRFGGIRPLLQAVFALKNARQKPAVDTASNPPEIATTTDEAMLGCDMARVELAPLEISMALGRHLPRERVLARRRANFAAYERAFAEVAGARPLFADPPVSAAPYVFPLWVDDADRVYQAIREAGLPVYRWDRTWPGMPRWPDDTGLQWSRHVLQLLCHQDLSPADVASTADLIAQMLRGAGASSRSSTTNRSTDGGSTRLAL